MKLFTWLKALNDRIELAADESLAKTERLKDTSDERMRQWEVEQADKQNARILIHAKYMEKNKLTPEEQKRVDDWKLEGGFKQ
ncbi:hypothetical protein EKG38_14040 [Shewanella canadensis]|uniref:Uncharacterized protein n=1 Tax=Shewanella canadensis TaxID=271096 RepID=A0A3S0IMP8_9GAMM|nr:hypothetical protein [Shewanella canadensis]RTR38620.1 hypothetical protein EKG38_14040 [Shewanella canadensis]